MARFNDLTRHIDLEPLLKKPLWQMTGEEFLALNRSAAPQTATEATPVDRNPAEATIRYDEGKYVFGLKGICDLFGVAKCTAIRYKETFLKPAVIQRGRKIMVDREKAMELFKKNQL